MNFWVPASTSVGSRTYLDCGAVIYGIVPPCACYKLECMRFRITADAKDFLCALKYLDQPFGQQLYSFPGTKHPDYEANHTCSCKVEVQNA